MLRDLDHARQRRRLLNTVVAAKQFGGDRIRSLVCEIEEITENDMKKGSISGCSTDALVAFSPIYLCALGVSPCRWIHTSRI
jgi:hypothetical protein